MTGRGMGYCAGVPAPGYMNPGYGRGGFGRGGCRGWRHWYRATGLPGWVRAEQGMPVYPPSPTPNVESAMLKNQAEFLKQQLEEIQSRISDLESSKTQ
jgi:hypothetical protein